MIMIANEKSQIDHGHGPMNNYLNWRLLSTLLIILLLAGCGCDPGKDDLAIVKLNPDGLASESARKILLAIPPMKLGNPGDWSINSAAIITGFGMTGHATRDYPIKREGKITIVDCDNDDTEGFICFDFNNETLTHANCARDSGGPMIREVSGQYLLIGVASRADANCEAGEALYVDITGDRRRSWIENNITPPAPFGFVLNTVSIQGELASSGQFTQHAYPVATSSEYLTATVNFPWTTPSAGAAIYNNFQLSLSHSSGAVVCDNSFPELGTCAKDSPQPGSWTGRVDAVTGNHIFQLTFAQLQEIPAISNEAP